MRGLLGQAHQSTNAMFHEIIDNPVFNVTKSINSFKFLIAHIPFDNHVTRPTPWQQDRFAAFHEILKNLAKTVGNF